MWNRKNKHSDSYRIASSHLITTCATFAAIILFTLIGSQVVPAALGIAADHHSSTNGLAVALVLNIAIILFGWQRSKELARTLAALGLAEREAHRNAYVDCVTGLANRRALVNALGDAIARDVPQGALVLFDLDHFKKVNDLHGHSAGDKLLAHVGRTLKAMMPNATLVARLGGDEFGVLLAATDAQDVEAVVGRVIATLGSPIDLDTFHAHISASAGIAALAAGLSPEDMLRRADIAMYAAKRSGRDGASWFDADQEAELKARVTLEDDIRSGIEAGEFVPFFQPLITLATGKPTGFEVLARWKSPQRGLLEPAEFIEVAEATGLIAPLSMLVMRQALEEAKSWPPHLKIAVNISPVQFRDPQLAERVLKMLAETGFPARRLELEITEGSLLENPEQATTIVKSLKNNGITIALDDFGTGYASLTQLQSLPFDRIKIDKSFVATIGENEQSEMIVRTIASLGKMLCVPITAEGVETESIRLRLAEAGCQDAQGWLFGRAISAQFIRNQFGLSDADHPSEDAEKPVPLASRAVSGRKW
ncbi:MAG: putative bifunctional diguanylate cyclase/phosphodiesterase [Sphingomicrobium sp.]